MTYDSIRRLIAVNGQVSECLKWAIHNKQLECEEKLEPVVEGIASVLVDMVEREEENFTRRGRIRLAKKRGGLRPSYEHRDLLS